MERLVRRADQNRGADRTTAVKTFAQEPLAAFALQIARGNIAGDRVTEHVIERLRAVDLLRRLTDDDGQFALVIQRLCYVGMARQRR